MEHIVAVALPVDGLAADVAALVEIGLLVGEQLAGMVAIGQLIDHRHARLGRVQFELAVVLSAYGDDVDHARQHPRRIFYGLSAAELGVARR